MGCLGKDAGALIKTLSASSKHENHEVERNQVDLQYAQYSPLIIKKDAAKVHIQPFYSKWEMSSPLLTFPYSPGFPPPMVLGKKKKISVHD